MDTVTDSERVANECMTGWLRVDLKGLQLAGHRIESVKNISRALGLRFKKKKTNEFRVFM